jgi:hypothetical protein
MDDPRDPQKNSVPDQDSLDFDLGPAGPYADQRPDYYPPPKKGGPLKVWLGVVLAAAVLGATWYSFRTEPASETPPAAAAPAGEPAAAQGSGAESSSVEQHLGVGAGDFSPIPPPPPAVSSEVSPAGAAPSSPKPAPKPAEDKPSAASSTAAPSAAKPAENKPSAASSTAAPSAAKPAENKPAPAAASTAAPSAAKPAENKPAPAASSTSAPSTAKPAENKPAPAASSTSAPSAADSAKPAEGPAAVETETPGAAISDQWVVNISSTPDEEESKRLWAQFDKQVVGRKLYSYQTTINGRVQYRIRMGFFATRAEAEAAGQKIKENLGLTPIPWAVQPTADEVEKFK